MLKVLALKQATLFLVTMKPQSKILLAIATVTLSFANIFTLPSYAVEPEEARFSCKILGSPPAPTITASTAWIDDLPIIRWVSVGFGSQWAAKTRCDTVAKRLESFYPCGLLTKDHISKDLITPGLGQKSYPALVTQVDQKVMNRCKEVTLDGRVISLKEGDKLLLFMLESNDDPERVIRQIDEIRSGEEIPVCDTSPITNSGLCNPK